MLNDFVSTLLSNLETADVVTPSLLFSIPHMIMCCNVFGASSLTCLGMILALVFFDMGIVYLFHIVDNVP